MIRIKKTVAVLEKKTLVSTRSYSSSSRFKISFDKTRQIKYEYERNLKEVLDRQSVIDQRFITFTMEGRSDDQ